MFRFAAILPLFLASVSVASTFVIVDQSNTLAVELSQGRYVLPPEVKANPHDYVAVCDAETCSNDTIQFKSILSLIDCGPNEYETGREDAEFITADGGLFCARIPKCEQLPLGRP